MALRFTCIGDIFLGLVEERFLRLRGELLLGLIAEVFASRVEEGVSQRFRGVERTDRKGRLPKVRHDDNGSVGFIDLRFFEF